MALIPRQTYPELTALTAPVVDGDVLAAYRSPGPLRRLTASTFADYIKAFFSASGGSALVNYTGAGTGATPLTLQTYLRSLAVNVLDYGAVADAAYNPTTSAVTGTNNFAAFQAALNYAMSVGKSVYVPAGRYKIDNTTPLVFGSRTEYISLCLFGEGYGYRGEMAGTNLYFTNAQQPGFATMGIRGGSIRAVSMIGPNGIYAVNEGLAHFNKTPGIDDLDLTEFIRPSLLAANPNMLSQFSLNAAVATDPFMGTAPATPYPGATYGVTFNTSQMLVQDCYIAGWGAAMVLQPSDVSSQSEYSGLRGCVIEGCPWILSVGSSQARNNIFDDNVFGYCHTALTNKHHGQKIGQMHGSYRNNNTYALIQLVDIAMQAAGPMEIADFDGEQMWRIGNLSSGNVLSSPMVFSNMYNRMGLATNIAKRGTPSTLLTNVGGVPVVFLGGSFWLGDYKVMVLDGPAESYTFDGTVINGGHRDNGAAISECERVGYNFLTGVCFAISSSNTNRPAGFNVMHVDRLNVDDGSNAGRSYELISNRVRASRTVNISAWSQTAAPRSKEAIQTTVAPMWQLLEVAAGLYNTASVTNDVLSGTFATGYSSEIVRREYGLVPGGIIYYATGNYVLMIETVTQATNSAFTARILNGLNPAATATIGIGATGYNDSGVPIAPVLFDHTAGLLYIGNSAIFMPEYNTVGDFTTATNVVSNVGRGDGFAGYVTTSFIVGDCLYYDYVNDVLIPAAVAKLTAVTAGTLTMSGGANRIATRQPVNFLLREIANKP